MPADDQPSRPDPERRLRQATRFARVLRVLEIIQGRGRYGVKEIAAELETSERTIFRDLAVLELAGVPYYHDREVQCLRVRPGFQFPVINLTDDELIGQATSAALTSAPGLDVTKGSSPTTRKLRATTREEAAKLIAEVERVTSVLDLKLADHSRHHETIRTMQWALIQGRRLTGTYGSPYEPKPKRLDLHPYRLCLVKQAWYLIARPERSDHPQTYRVARFKTLRPLDGPSVVPADFDLQSYFGNAWGVYRGDRSYEVQVRFSREAADLVTETTWHSTQTIERHKDGSVTLSFLVDGLNEIVHWILGWSGRATVVRPDTLRLAVLDQLRRATELNQGD
jgi:predicted DNA-binding transcriptional regulator YafY